MPEPTVAISSGGEAHREGRHHPHQNARRTEEQRGRDERPKALGDGNAAEHGEEGLRRREDHEEEDPAAREERGQHPRVGPAVGQAPAEGVSERERREKSRDQGPPDEQRGPEDRSEDTAPHDLEPHQGRAREENGRVEAPTRAGGRRHARASAA